MTDLEAILSDNDSILSPRIYTVHGSDLEAESGLSADEALDRVTESERSGPYSVCLPEGATLLALIDRDGAVVRGIKGGTVDEVLKRFMSDRIGSSRSIYTGPFISTDADYRRDLEEAVDADLA